MDGITEKFNVFDFFNLEICGLVFLFALGICHFEQVKKMIFTIAEKTEHGFFLSVLILAVAISCALVIGMTLQVLGHFIIKEKIGWENNIVSKCLRKNVLFNNNVRRKEIVKRANEYFKTGNKYKKLSSRQCATFYAHCEYYLYIRELDKKAEKMRETQGLSENFTCVFMIAPIVSICIYIINLVCFELESIKLWRVLSIYMLYLLLAFLFYYRYKVVSKNRIRMILSIYDVAVEKENKVT